MRCDHKTITAAAASGAAKSKGRVLCFMAPTSEPIDPTGWPGWERSSATTSSRPRPMLVHPERTGLGGHARSTCGSASWASTWSASGLSGPVASARDAGTPAQPDQPVCEVAAASGACLVVDRVAFDEAGGLASIDDFDAAVVDLCGRLRAGGGKVVAVPSAVVLDHRPVRSMRALTRPIDPSSPDWRQVVDRQGPDPAGPGPR